MRGNADRCIANTLIYEGAFGKTAKDRGDWSSGQIGVGKLIGTNWGIAAMTMRERGLPEDFDLRSLTKQQAIELYKKKEWPESYGDHWPKGLDQVTYDAVVNSGKGRLSWTVKACGGANVKEAIVRANEAGAAARQAMVKKQIAIRVAFLRGLSTFETFGKGWIKRCVGMEAIGVKMVLESTGASPIEQRQVLEGEAKVAGIKEKTAATTTAATAAPTATAPTQIDPGQFDWTAWALCGVLGVAAVCVVAFFAFQAWKNHERRKAYEAVAAGTLG